MNWNIDDLFEEYRRADFNKQLHFYLQYPDLRPKFFEMDRNNVKREGTDDLPRFARLAKIPAGSLFNLKSVCEEVFRHSLNRT